MLASAARVGHDPNDILNHLRELILTQTYPNMAIALLSGGGIENFNTVPAAMVEMLAQSFQNKLIVFANWPNNTYAKFGDLMAYGNFLISSKIDNNIIQYLRVISKKGRDLTFINPWPDQILRIYRNGTDSGILAGNEITISTVHNEMIHMAPNGTIYNDILLQML
jgi:alpha-L-fucosidase 2